MFLGGLLGTAASSLDRAVVRAATWNTQRSAPRIGRLTHEERMAALENITATYGDPRHVGSRDLLFPQPEPIHVRCERVRDLGSLGGVFDATWPSDHMCLNDDIRHGYAAHANNRLGNARLFLSPRPRPTVIAIHGYMGGAYRFEERAFPVRWMMRRGFDVALVTLPFHGLRARTDRPGTPLFPGADPRFTIEGCRQSVRDIQSLVRFLRARGAPSVGVMGMSLGGYLTSLVATLEPDLSFAVPIIPLASFADFARDQGRFGDGAKGERQYRAYDHAMQVVSPLARPSLIAPERVLVLAGAHDRVTPKTHADRLAAHFASRMVVFPGGHLLQFGRAEAFREIGRLWKRLGLGSARHIG